VDLRLKVGTLPALIDTGTQFSCFRIDVAEFVHLMGQPCHFKSCSMVCSLANGQRCDVTDAVKLHVKFMPFSWDHEFKILKGGPFPAIFELHFLERTQMLGDVADRKFSFAFAPCRVASFVVPKENLQGETYFQRLRDEAGKLTSLSGVQASGLEVDSITADLTGLISKNLGTVRCAAYEIELSDTTPVRSPPYRCAPPKAAIFGGWWWITAW